MITSFTDFHWLTFFLQEIGGRTINVNFAKQRPPREAGSFNRARATY
jgi:hypothetical protein